MRVWEHCLPILGGAYTGNLPPAPCGGLIGRQAEMFFCRGPSTGISAGIISKAGAVSGSRNEYDESPVLWEMTVHKVVICILTGVMLAGCGVPTRTPIPAQAFPGQGTAAPGRNDPGVILSTPAQGGPLPVTQVAPVPTGQSGLPLSVLWPLDEAVVSTSSIEVMGTTGPGNVVSVNDVIVIAGEDGSFKAVIPLEEGPNLLEVVASDEAGNETWVTLTIGYEP